MIARLVFLLILSMGCVHGTSLREDRSQLSGTEGIIISGGNFDESSVEVVFPSTGESCSLPSVPDDRSGHTMDGLLICGGYYVRAATNCLSFTSGNWSTSHTLVEERSDHSSWQTEQGLVLMGGRFGGLDTSEIVSTAGDQGEPSFDMQYETEQACSMPDLTSESVIITGGLDTMIRTTVSRYGVLGWVEDLPSLLVGRFDHGCGSFISGDGTQVLLVAGGWGSYSSTDFLSSTEVLTMDSSTWTLTTPLPWAVTGLRGVNLGGSLFMTGGWGNLEGGLGSSDKILGWLDEEQLWEEFGKMKEARSDHAVTTIHMDDQAMEHCD